MYLKFGELLGLVMICGYASTIPAVALDDARLKQQLLKLDPETRLEQTCDTEVMLRIGQEQNFPDVDRVVAYAFGDPTFGKNSITAPGAAFRRGGAWYHLSYDCTTGPRHLDAHSLHYKIGAKVPRKEWGEHDLYD